MTRSIEVAALIKQLGIKIPKPSDSWNEDKYLEHIYFWIRQALNSNERKAWSNLNRFNALSQDDKKALIKNISREFIK